MKKVIHKLRKNRAEKAKPSRITNDTVAEHRERVLAGGRKFKYPIQYARHKLIIVTIVISLLALIVIAALGWWQLYPAQNTSTFMYRVTRVIPVPVAVVDGSAVRYSDYLMRYKSAEYYLRTKERAELTSEDGVRQLNHYKQRSMEDAVADTYAARLAKDLDVKVTDQELDTFLSAQRKLVDGEVSQRTYDAVVRDYYDWSPEEYRDVMRAKLLRQKVSYAVDETAKKQIDTIREVVAGKKETPLTTIADEVKSRAASASYGASGWVPHANQDGGLAQVAVALEKGQESQVVTSTAGDGYYIIRLIDKNEKQVNYEYIKVPLSEFANRLSALYADGKIQYYIGVTKPGQEE